MNCTEDKFLHDVREHVMEIIRDDGVYRHVRFKRPGTHCQYFDLVTWPGVLSFTGDMGTFVFSRLHDMFDFFRTDRLHLSNGRTLGINPCYWSEKLIAVDGNRNRGGAWQFSEERFRQVINEQRIEWIREARQPCSAGYLERDDRRDLWEAVDREVFGALGDDGEQAAYIAARDFEWRAPGSPVTWCFNDLWDHDFTEYTFRFLWCCYALAWGIQRYDEAKEADRSEGGHHAALH